MGIGSKMMQGDYIGATVDMGVMGIKTGVGFAKGAAGAVGSAGKAGLAMGAAGLSQLS